MVPSSYFPAPSARIQVFSLRQGRPLPLHQGGSCLHLTTSRRHARAELSCQVLDGAKELLHHPPPRHHGPGGPTISFMGLHIQRNADHISVDRRGYIEKLAAKRDPKDINLTVLNTSSTPSISLPPHSLSSPIMELRYVDDVRPATTHLTSPCRCPRQRWPSRRRPTSSSAT